MLSKILGGTTGLFLVMLLVALWQREQFRGQRDVARTQLAAARVALEAEVISTKTAMGAANQCKIEFDDRDARLRAALDEATAATERARRAARVCQSDETVAQRLGEVTQ